MVQTVSARQRMSCPVEGKGRFPPVSVNGWFGEHTINLPALRPLATTDEPAALGAAKQ